MKSNKKLGKGLKAIFGDGFEEVVLQIENNIENFADKVVEIDLVNLIPNPYNPRKQFNEDSLKELAHSISESGLLTPIVVKKTKDNKYYIVAGERRFRATQLAGLKKIKAIIVDYDDQKMHELALVENIQREDLNPIDEALAIQTLINKFKITHEDLSKKLGKSRTYITNALRILNLDKKILALVSSNKLTVGHIRPLINLESETSLKLADKIVNENWTVRKVESYVNFISKKKTNSKKMNTTNEFSYVEDLFRKKLGIKVSIKNGKLIVLFKSTDQLNAILTKLNLIED